MPLPRPSPKDGFTFTWDPSVEHLNVSMKEYVSTHAGLDATCTGALVFSRAAAGGGDGQEDRILLMQRAPTDSMPLRWEVPGGGCDWDDASLLHALARELWEESGLLLRAVVRQVGEPHLFATRRGLRIAKFTFEVQVEGEGGALPQVTLDPNEHVRFLWATEEECRRHRVAVGDGGEEVVDIEFTTKAQFEDILLGYRLRREAEVKAVESVLA
ncbi:NUDIX hydrolase domain-like protein [Lasiosphaeria miniovina]|uniref:NUDIX hydrolase domain-like protein n=1 Tax=Lasiosphaeria miniovina TaxID=1954250 RepID=A0AA39ZUB2_9PEZI|nr:NUDIX hydrolase domain-like protein [Lasiosphaeria miniovina]KAK0703874.1 NUDIX hydrolase domain-like protein [Lasiosphaeria miniovina]